MPKKSSGQIGPTRITAGPNGTVAEYMPAPLPVHKEGLEQYFADVFVRNYNESLPLGPGTEIAAYRQNDTSDLDFTITSAVAEFLELAELSPRSEPFGREAFRTGALPVHEYARWIYFSLIAKKQKSYGVTARKTILLLYCSHWQFYPHEVLIDCVVAWCKTNGADFAAIFVVQTNGSDLVLNNQVWPGPARHIRPPKVFKKLTYSNFEPGKTSWQV